MNQKSQSGKKHLFELSSNCLSNSVFSAKEEMFLSNLHVLAGGSLLFTEKTDCEIAHYSELVALVSM